MELFHGGFLAPNIYYLGQSGCVKFGGLRIAGSSGIFKGNHYWMGNGERVPFSDGALRSVYHTRVLQIVKLGLLGVSSAKDSVAKEGEKGKEDGVDIFLSHDWPSAITSYATPSNLDSLLRAKPFFKKDIETGKSIFLLPLVLPSIHLFTIHPIHPCSYSST